MGSINSYYSGSEREEQDSLSRAFAYAERICELDAKTLQEDDIKIFNAEQQKNLHTAIQQHKAAKRAMHFFLRWIEAFLNWIGLGNRKELQFYQAHFRIEKETLQQCRSVAYREIELVPLEHAVPLPPKEEAPIRETVSNTDKLVLFFKKLKDFDLYSGLEENLRKHFSSEFTISQENENELIIDLGEEKRVQVNLDRTISKEQFLKLNREVPREDSPKMADISDGVGLPQCKDVLLHKTRIPLEENPPISKLSYFKSIGAMSTSNLLKKPLHLSRQIKLKLNPSLDGMEITGIAKQPMHLALHDPSCHAIKLRSRIYYKWFEDTMSIHDVCALAKIMSMKRESLLERSGVEPLASTMPLLRSTN